MIDWNVDLTEALQQSGRSRKPVLVYVRKEG